jgi:hypothetical protein
MSSTVYVLRVTEGLSLGVVCLGVYSSELAARLALMLARSQLCMAKFTIEALPLDEPLRFPRGAVAEGGPEDKELQTLAKSLDYLRKVVISTDLAREMRDTLDEPNDELEELFQTGALTQQDDAAVSRIAEVIANITC